MQSRPGSGTLLAYVAREARLGPARSGDGPGVERPPRPEIMAKTLRTTRPSRSPRRNRRAGLVAGASVLAGALAIGPWAGSELSAQTVVPGRCGPDARGVEVAGAVADMLSRRPLAGAVVTLRAPAAFVHQIIGRSQAGVEGRFVFCAEAVGEGWDVIAELDSLSSREVPVGPQGQVDTLYIAWSEPVSLAGTVRVQGGDAPVPGARITIEDRPVRGLTDDEGRFSLRGLGAGPLVVTTSHIAYAPRVDTILAESGASLSLDIRLGHEAVELDPIVVTARRPPTTRMRGTRELGMTASEVAEALPRSIDFLALLRQANIPGLIIQRTAGPDGICVEFLRASGGCAMLQVFVNGIRVSNPGVMLLSLDPVMVEEFIVLRPAFAQFQYMGPLTPNGVIDIILK